MIAAALCLPLYMPPASLEVPAHGRVVYLNTDLLQNRARALGVPHWRTVYGAWVAALDTIYIARDIPEECKRAVLRHERAHRNNGWTHPGMVRQ